jgi:uncharacterized membrane protein YjdF
MKLMRKNLILLTAFVLIILLGLLHFLANWLYLYWTVEWFDVLMHFLGGFAGALLVVWFLREGEVSWRKFLIPLVSVLIAGVAWEIFEYTNNITQLTDGYVLDTTKDLFVGVLGAITAVVVSRAYQSNSGNNYNS